MKVGVFWVFLNKGHPAVMVGAKLGIGQEFLGCSTLRLFGARAGAELGIG